jgi:hypothetical protein
LRKAQKKVKGITRDRLARMSVANSSDMPQEVNDHGVLRKWVGIGWIDIGKPTGKEPKVIG